VTLRALAENKLQRRLSEASCFTALPRVAFEI
jgi:hypothetical protein